MRLKSIKLAGFKSFVDPTTVNFPSNMAAVVGPNGCGKSNIIDAVRWVMGESSAKNLRGESMTDVIFNGSNTRKPVSQASIELIFDNAETTGGRIRPVRRDIHSPAGLAGWAEHLFSQRHQVPAARHHRHLPRHRPGAAQLLDHRTGHDLQADRGASGRPAQLHRGSRGHFQVQGAPPRNRKPHPSDPGKPGTPHRPARRAWGGNWNACTGRPSRRKNTRNTRPRSASSRPNWVPCAGAT